MDAAHSLIETYAKGGSAEPIVIERETNNLDRTLGTMLSAKVSKACGKPGLPDDAVRIKLEGSSGQSLGFALAPGITIEVIGDANDGCSKGLSGGRQFCRMPTWQLQALSVPRLGRLVLLTSQRRSRHRAAKPLQ